MEQCLLFTDLRVLNKGVWEKKVLPLLTAYGAALALEDLRALKPKGVILLIKKQSSEK
jgi:hypothetical protein